MHHWGKGVGGTWATGKVARAREMGCAEGLGLGWGLGGNGDGEAPQQSGGGRERETDGSEVPHKRPRMLNAAQTNDCSSA